jgi:hypothetical protein
MKVEKWKKVYGVLRAFFIAGFLSAFVSFVSDVWARSEEVKIETFYTAGSGVGANVIQGLYGEINTTAPNPHNATGVLLKSKNEKPYVVAQVGTADANSAFTVYNGTNHLLYVRGDGNVGIGMPNPASLLHLNGPDDDATNTDILTYQLGGGGIRYRIGVNAAATANRASYWTVNYKPSTLSRDNTAFGSSMIQLLAEDAVNENTLSGIIFNSGRASDATPPARMIINQLGNVGIGTTTPSAPLTVKSSTIYGGTSAVQRIDYADGSQYNLQLNQDVGNNVVSWRFSQRNNNTDYPNVLVLDRGNVGIGTTAPVARTHVSSPGGRALYVEGHGSYYPLMFVRNVSDYGNAYENDPRRSNPYQAPWGNATLQGDWGRWAAAIRGEYAGANGVAILGIQDTQNRIAGYQESAGVFGWSNGPGNWSSSDRGGGTGGSPAAWSAGVYGRNVHPSSEQVAGVIGEVYSPNGLSAWFRGGRGARVEGNLRVDGNLGIGTGSQDTIWGNWPKLDVVKDSGAGILVRGSTWWSQSPDYGVYATGKYYGVLGYSTEQSSSGSGLYGYAYSPASYGWKTGLYATGYTGGNSSTAYGVYAVGSSWGSGGKGYGVYAYGSTYDFYAASGRLSWASSLRWKENVQPIPNALSRVVQLRGVTFDWDKAHGGKHDLGMIAEEFGKVFPELTDYEPGGKYAAGMDYGKFNAVLVEAIKEQQRQINALKAEVATLKQQKHD